MKNSVIKKIRRIAALLAVFTLVLGLVACGGSGESNTGSKSGSGDKTVASDDSKGSSDSNGDNGGVKASDLPSDKGDGSFMIYKVGSDILAFVVKSKECEKLLPKSEYEESDWHMSIRSDDWNSQIGMASFYANVGFKTEGSDEWYNASSDYQRNYLDKDTYFAFIYDAGICDKIKLLGDLRLSVYRNSDNGETDIVTIDSSKAVKEVSFSEFGEIYGAVCKIEKPKGNWAGTYLTDGYGDYTGTIEVDVSDSGIIHIVVKLEGEEKEFIATEEAYDSGDPNYFYADAKIINKSDRDTKYSNIQFSSRIDYNGEVEEGLSYNTDDYSSQQSQYKSCSLDKFKEYHVAPANYEDKDLGGKILRKDPDDKDYFTPKTDDYIIVGNYMQEYSSIGVSSYDSYRLYSFDSLGRTVQIADKYIFVSAEEAQKFYDEYNKYPSESSKYTLCGTILYRTYDPVKGYVYSNTKMDSFSSGYGYGWYYDVHYINEYKDDNGNYKHQMYISKPYTRENFNVTPEDVAYWNDDTKRGSHRSTLYKNSSLYTYMDSSYGNFSINLEGYTDDQGNSPIAMKEIRLAGKSLVGFGISNKYINNQSCYVLAFTEIEFTDTVANSTQYCFIVDDPFSMDYTFDNYKSKTPDFVYKNTFDMTRKE
ncbi:MAG: hypothetical protein K6E32_03250 [Lachnospiraceae bacterium]|nr:hypothetical protein [Lachnospiraceae bacterium]